MRKTRYGIKLNIVHINTVTLPRLRFHCNTCLSGLMDFIPVITVSLQTSPATIGRNFDRSCMAGFPTWEKSLLLLSVFSSISLLLTHHSCGKEHHMNFHICVFNNQVLKAPLQVQFIINQFI